MKRLLSLTILFALFMVARVDAQPAFQIAANDGNDSTTSLTFSLTVSSGTDRYMACGVSTLDTTINATSVTYGGTALTQRHVVDNAGGLQAHSEYWDLIAPTVGTANVVVTMSATVAVAAGCVVYTGVDQTTPRGTFADAIGNSNTSSVSASSVSGDLVIDVTSVRTGTTTLTAGTGQTERVEKQSNTGVGNTTVAMSQKAGASSVTMSWAVDDTTSKVWAAQAVSLHASGTAPPPGGTPKVCASGCTYNNSQLQAALDAAVCGDTILLQENTTYVAPDRGFVLGVRCTTGTWDRITLRTGVSSTGTVLPDSDFPAANIRMSTSYRTKLAKLQPGVNNSPAIRTIWPGETGKHGCTVAPCKAEGWTIALLEFIPKTPFAGGAMIHIGTNDAAFDVDNNDNQNRVNEVPDYNTIRQIDMHGDPVLGQHQGIRYSGGIGRVVDSSVRDIKSIAETQALTVVNALGPLTVTNNYLEGSGENFITGGADTYLAYSATVTSSPTPSTTVFSLTNVEDMFVGLPIAVTLPDTHSWMTKVSAISGTQVTVSPALPTAPAVSGLVEWTRDFGGLTFRKNYLSKPTAWRNPIVAPPTSVSVTCTTTGGSLPAGTYYYRLAAKMLVNISQTPLSAATAQASGTVASGTTGKCTVTWTETSGADQGTNIYGRSNGVADNRWSVLAGISTFTDTGSPGAAETAPNSGAVWFVKNVFETKVCDGYSPQGPCLVEGNVFEYSWLNGQTGPIGVIKMVNQGGGDVSVTTRNMIIRYNIFRHGTAAVQFCVFDCETKRAWMMEDITFTDNLAYDISTFWGSEAPTIIVTGGEWPYVTQNKGAYRMKIYHNTILGDATHNGIWLDVLSATPNTKETDFELKNNIFRRGNGGLITIYDGSFGGGGGEGTAAFNAATQGTSSATKNAWISVGETGSACTSYPDTPNNFCPTEATFQSYLVNYTNCIAGTIASCALTGSTPLDNASSDSRDVGADIVALNALTADALSGNNSGEPAPLTITTTSPLPGGTVSTAYSQTIVATGGSQPYAWSVFSGTLPAGLSLNSSSGVLSGTPTTAGVYAFTIRVTDVTSTTDDQAFGLTIASSGATVTITGPATLPFGVVGQAYSQAITVSGGTAPYTCTKFSGSAIPLGLTLNSSTCTISGTPTTSGSVTFVIRATDAAAAHDDKTYTLTRLVKRQIVVGGDERNYYAGEDEPSLINGRQVIAGDLWLQPSTDVLKKRRTDGTWEVIGVGRSSKPTCDATLGGTTWYTKGIAGVKDQVEVCAKDASNTYAWRVIF